MEKSSNAEVNMPVTSPQFAASPAQYESVRDELRELRAALSKLQVETSKRDADTLEFLFKIYYVTTLAGLVGFMFLLFRG